MEIKDNEYGQLMGHIDDLKRICEKLKLNLGLLELPIQNGTDGTKLLSLEDLEMCDSSSSASSESSSEEGLS